MRFTIGPYVYRLIFDGLPEGQFGEMRRAGRLVVLSTQCPSEEALPTLIHELWHAWRDVFPVAFDNDESEAEFYGNMLTQVHRELVNQGGERALLALISEDKKAKANHIKKRAMNNEQA